MMKNMLKTPIASSLILALILGVSALVAQEHRRAGSERLSEYLGLSADQTAAIDQEVENFEKNYKPMFAKLGQYEGQMEKLIQSGDATAIGRLFLDRIALNKQLMEERKALQARLRSILTPDQTDKLDKAQEVLRFSGEGASLLGPLSIGLEEGEGLKVRGGGMTLRHREAPIR
jgi:Spy/CpxP family protein refolding chaperone